MCIHRRDERQLVSRDVVGTDLAVAVQPETEALVYRADLLPIGIAIQAQPPLAELPRPPGRPCQQPRRHALALEGAADDEPVNESRVVLRNIRPELKVDVLKTDSAGDDTVDVSKKELPVVDLPRDACRIELAFFPHHDAERVYPTRSLEQHLLDYRRIPRRCLPYVDLSRA